MSEVFTKSAFDAVASSSWAVYNLEPPMLQRRGSAGPVWTMGDFLLVCEDTEEAYLIAEVAPASSGDRGRVRMARVTWRQGAILRQAAARGQYVRPGGLRWEEPSNRVAMAVWLALPRELSRTIQEEDRHGQRSA